MAENQPKIKVPNAYKGIVEDLRLLQRDGQNPDKMMAKQKAATWKSLCDFGGFTP